MRWAEAALAIASLAVTAVVGEVCLRLVPSKPAPVPVRLRPGEFGLPRLEGVLALARPNQRGLRKGVLHETNSAGMRDREYSLRKPRGVFRLAVIGDSVAMGEGVRVEDSYPEIIERQLLARWPGRFEVLNLAISGLNTAAAVRRLERPGLAFSPDLVIDGYTLNDIEGPSYEQRWPRAPELDPAIRFSKSRLFDFLRRRLFSLREIVSPPRGSYVRELDDNYFGNPAAWKDVLAGLDRLAALGGEHGFCVLVFVHTRLQHLHPWHPFLRHYDKVLRAARERGLFAVSSRDEFGWRRGEELWVAWFDQHPNEEGHEILARSLWKALGRLPARCWKDAPAPAGPWVRRSSD